MAMRVPVTAQCSDKVIDAYMSDRSTAKVLPGLGDLIRFGLLPVGAMRFAVGNIDADAVVHADGEAPLACQVQGGMHACTRSVRAWHTVQRLQMCRGW